MSAYAALPSASDAQPGPSSRPIQARVLPALAVASSSYTPPALTPATFHSTPAAKRTSDEDGESANGGEDGKKKKGKRRKVNHACLYCRRSHMTCDEGRPCQRCLKREIGHLCHDEPRQSSRGAESIPPTATGSTSTPASTNYFSRPMPTPIYSMPAPVPIAPAGPWPIMALPQGAFLYPAETPRNEFSVLSEFLDTLDERSFFNPPPSSVDPNSMPAPSAPFTASNSASSKSSSSSAAPASDHSSEPGASTSATPTKQEAEQSTPIPASSTDNSDGAVPASDEVMQAEAEALGEGSSAHSVDVSVSDVHGEDTVAVEKILPAATKTERFLLTAADQEPGSRDERLNRVIRSKYEAGLLKPYNYVKGYARLSRWMDRNVSQQSKQQIIQPLSVLRPKFRAVAQTLTDIDHVFIEEAFERLLLDYDRVFSAMGIPACLWRRTGEIYKGNREFAELVGVDGYLLRDGRLCIYELMAEESAVNYWEKYGHVAFDSKQKAVLTSCILRYKPALASSSSTIPPPGPASAMGLVTGSATGGSAPPAKSEEGFINCCFSITIRRDAWGIPSMIVGNFIKC